MGTQHFAQTAPLVSNHPLIEWTRQKWVPKDRAQQHWLLNGGALENGTQKISVESIADLKKEVAKYLDSHGRANEALQEVLLKIEDKFLLGQTEDVQRVSGFAR